MKTVKDPRHIKRQEAVKSLYAQSFTKQPSISPVAKEVFENIEAVDDKIRVIAPEFPVEKINKVDLAILRLAVYEIMKGKEPHKVVIDEAIELGKEYGGETSASFINGALGKLVKQVQK